MFAIDAHCGDRSVMSRVFHTEQNSHRPKVHDDYSGERGSIDQVRCSFYAIE